MPSLNNIQISVSLGEETFSIPFASGIIPGVSVMTSGPVLTHGVFADEQTLETLKAAGEQKGAVKSKLDHSSGVAAIIGAMKNFRIEGDKLLADLHLLKTHAAYDTIREMAAEIPKAFGLSIHAGVTLEKADDKDYVRITDLMSVDLVTDPAANPNGLFSFSQRMAAKATPPAPGQARVPGESQIEALADLCRAVIGPGPVAAALHEPNYIDVGPDSLAARAARVRHDAYQSKLLRDEFAKVAREKELARQSGPARQARFDKLRWLIFRTGLDVPGLSFFGLNMYPGKERDFEQDPKTIAFLQAKVSLYCGVLSGDPKAARSMDRAAEAARQFMRARSGSTMERYTVGQTFSTTPGNWPWSV